MTTLREKIARTIAFAHSGFESDWERHLSEADDVLAIPRIADALKLTPVKPLNLGPSVSTDKRKPV